MRTVGLALWALGIAAAAGAAESQPLRFPYKAYVIAEDVHVRSGPGENYYPTDTLRLGQKIEVYRHDPGGWLAIRPVPGSFSWVAARYLEAKDNGLAAVSEDHVAARVGSRMSDVRDIIQIRLQRGEVVELLEPMPANVRGEGSWCKIAPPSGEFRWVYSKYVDRNYPHDGLSKHRDGKSTGDSDSAQLVCDEEPLDSDQFRAQLDGLEMELAIMVAEEPGVWSFDSLRQQAETLLGQAGSPIERGHARVLLSKLDRLADIKRRQDNVASVREESEFASRLQSGMGLRTAAATRPAQREGRFDGAGKLTELSSPKPGSPRYALMDDRGEVKYYVTPAPGVNLRHYLGREVGITGTRGYMPEQQAQHLMARHISALDDRLMR